MNKRMFKKLFFQKNVLFDTKFGRELKVKKTWLQSCLDYWIRAL